MKKKLTFSTLGISVLLILGLLMPQQMLAQREDMTQVLEKIISLPDLQKYYPISSNVQQVVIQQHPVSFPADLTLSDAMKNVVFMQMAETEAAKTPAFFKFRNFETNANTAKVVGHYFYNYNYQTKKSGIVAITANLVKSGSEWEILDVNVKEIQ